MEHRRSSIRLRDRLFIYFISGTLIGSLLLFFDNHSDVESITKECGVNIIKSFQNQHLTKIKMELPIFQHRENFSDLIELLKTTKMPLFNETFRKVVIYENKDSENPKFKDIFVAQATNSNSLEEFHWSISKYHMYDNDELVTKLLLDMATQLIEYVEEVSEVHAKLFVRFKNGIEAFLKPKRISREQQTLDNHFYFADYERHNAEIAAFHLDRVLEFRRLLPVVGRKFHIVNDLMKHSDHDLKSEFFLSPANNTCFRANCEAYCEILHPICGEPIVLEGSLIAYMPQMDRITTKFWISPWSRSFSPWEKAKWEIDYKFCRKVRHNHSEKRLLDLIDIALFDYLMGNQNRRSFETFEVFGNDSFPILQNNAQGFGKAFVDDHLILAPLYQCCMIRETTLVKLLSFHQGPKHLSEVMQISLANDPLRPVLWDPYFTALDRRIENILKEVRKCLSKKRAQLK